MVEQPITHEPDAIRAAFRAGVKGMRYTEHPDPAFDLPVMTDGPQGPNERHFETIERLPALSDPEAAYEAGRALRVIGTIMDTQSMPMTQGRMFLQKLAEAVLFFKSRNERQPWGAEATAFVFLEYLTAPEQIKGEMQQAIIKYAHKRPELRPR